MFTPHLRCLPSFAVYAEDTCAGTPSRTAPPSPLTCGANGDRVQAPVRGCRAWHAIPPPRIPRNKTAEASRRRSVDGASVRSDRPWRTQATAPPLLGPPSRSPEETVPPPTVLLRRRRKRSLPVPFAEKHRDANSKIDCETRFKDAAGELCTKRSLSLSF